MISYDKIWETVVAVIIAAFGGLAKLLHLKESKKLSLFQIFSEILVSSFAGFMVLLLARSRGVEGDMLGFLAGMSGWMGSVAVSGLEALYKRLIIGANASCSDKDSSSK